SFSVVSDAQITAASPPGTGTVDVTVTTPGGTSAVSPADQFTYLPPLAVAAIDPNQGPTAGSTNVIITGRGFPGAKAVQFGGTAAATFSVASDTQIRAISPAGTGAVHVVVTAAGGSSVATQADLFTYFSVTSPPALGSAEGGAGTPPGSL